MRIMKYSGQEEKSKEPDDRKPLNHKHILGIKRKETFDTTKNCLR